jgi:hypothetical protein
MLIAKPLSCFLLKERRIVSCKVLQGNPHEFLNKEVSFYSTEGHVKKIRIEGLSTASDLEHDIYDYLYTGAVIFPEEIGNGSVISDGTYSQ